MLYISFDNVYMYLIPLYIMGILSIDTNINNNRNGYQLKNKNLCPKSGILSISKSRWLAYNSLIWVFMLKYHG